ncbi:Protein argonaute-2, partial [Trichinella pseudospiralis]
LKLRFICWPGVLCKYFATFVATATCARQLCSGCVVLTTGVVVIVVRCCFSTLSSENHIKKINSYCNNYYHYELQFQPTENVMIQSDVSGPPAFTVSVRLGLPNEHIAGVRFRHTFVIPSTTTTSESGPLFVQPQIPTQLNYEPSPTTGDRQVNVRQQTTGDRRSRSRDRDHRGHRSHHSHRSHRSTDGNHRHRRHSRSSSQQETISDSEPCSKLITSNQCSFSPCQFSGLSSAATQQLQQSSGSRSDAPDLAINTFSEPEPAASRDDGHASSNTTRMLGDLLDRLEQFGSSPVDSIKETLIDDPAVPSPCSTTRSPADSSRETVRQDEPTRSNVRMSSSVDPETHNSTIFRSIGRPSPGISLVAVADEPKRFSSAAIFAMYAGQPGDRRQTNSRREQLTTSYSKVPIDRWSTDGDTSDLSAGQPIDRWSPEHLLVYDEGSVCHSDVLEPLEHSVPEDQSDSNETLVDELSSDHGDQPVTARQRFVDQTQLLSTGTASLLSVHQSNSLDHVHEAVICRQPIKDLCSLFTQQQHFTQPHPCWRPIVERRGDHSIVMEEFTVIDVVEGDDTKIDDSKNGQKAALPLPPPTEIPMDEFTVIDVVEGDDTKIEDNNKNRQESAPELKPPTDEDGNLDKWLFPIRPNVGNKGSKLKVFVNFIKMHFPEKLTLYEHEVKYSILLRGKESGKDKIPLYSSLEKRSLMIEAFNNVVKSAKSLKMPHYYYDGGNVLISTTPVASDSEEVLIANNVVGVVSVSFKIGLPRKLVVDIKSLLNSSNTISFESRCNEMRRLEFITSSVIANEAQCVMNGNFFKSSFELFKIGERFELRTGVFKSLRIIIGSENVNPDRWHLALNIDVKRAPFYTPQNVVNYLLEEFGLSTLETKKRWAPSEISTMQRKLIGLKVKASNTKFVWKIEDVIGKNALEEKYPYLPLVKNKRCTFPMEILDVVPNQKVPNKKLDENALSSVIRLSSITPFKRKCETLEKVSDLGLLKGQRLARDTGIHHTEELMTVTARVLDSFNILHGRDSKNQYVSHVTRSQWDMRNKELFNTARIDNWAVINFSDVATGDLKRFLKNLICKASECGIKISSSWSVFEDKAEKNPHSLESLFQNLVDHKVTYALCILPNTKDWFRGFLKYLSETKYGVITQCILKKTVIKATRDRNPDTLYFNLALKVNSKNGGVNNEVSQESDVIRTWMRPGVMFMGIDVNHPGNAGIKSDSKNAADLEPSVIGVVANCGKSVSDYRMQCRLQSSRQEQLDSVVFKEIVLWFLEKYEKKNGVLPESLIVYRDGVSESQFKMVVSSEVKVFKSAFEQIKENYSPKLTVIVVTKRHSAKFFKTNINSHTHVQEQNIPSGTVIDTVIVSPFLYDFYLCGHHGLLMLTYALCFTYQKCTRAVSLPSPVYHAHHVATRGKELFLAAIREKGDKNVKLEEIEMKLKIREKVSNGMFWARYRSEIRQTCTETKNRTKAQ